MPGDVGEGEAGPARQLLDAALALPKVFEQFETMRMAERVRDLGEASEYVLFGPRA